MRLAEVFRMTLARKRAMLGYIYISPFLVGLVFLFLYPVIESLRYSFGRIKLEMDGFEVVFTGLENYRYIFLLDSAFLPTFLRTLENTAVNVPLILIFSFFAAVLLNQKFRGRALARAIYFLPVIIMSGILMRFQEKSLALIDKAIVEASTFQPESNLRYVSAGLRQILARTQLSQGFIDYILFAIDNIYNIITQSGVQILIFLSALQTISPSLKEAASMDGSTAWEYFWKITFPIVSPYILVCTVYSLVDSFTASTNRVMSMITWQIFNQMQIGRGSAMAWAYFVVIGVVLALVSVWFSKRVYYYD